MLAVTGTKVMVSIVSMLMSAQLATTVMSMGLVPTTTVDTTALAMSATVVMDSSVQT